jgi:hypothetical protein
VTARITAVPVLLALAAVTPATAGEPDRTAPSYDVVLRGSDRGMRWHGRETITFANPGTAALDRIWVRLWGNGPFGCTRFQSVRIDPIAGATVGESEDCSAVPLMLTEPVRPGARGSVTFAVDIEPPNGAGRFSRDRHRLALVSNGIPVLAHLEGGLWRLDEYFPYGEAWTYPPADWKVRLDAPRGVAVAAPGVRQPGGVRRLRRGRDFSFAVGELRSLRGRAGNVAVTIWARRDADGPRLRRVMRIVRTRLHGLARLFGPYGRRQLQVVLAESNFGMEHSGMIMTDPRERTITHELAHEWWYDLIGSDQAAEPWLDEAFATYATEAVGVRRRPWCRRPGPQAVIEAVTREIDFFRDPNEHYELVYSEGACLLDMLRARMGHRRFRAALRAYALANRYGWSTGAEFRNAMDILSPVPLSDLWQLYRVGAP